MDVQVRPAAAPRTAEGGVSGARVVVPVVRREEEDGRILVEGVLGGVAVVIVPVHDQHLPVSAIILCVAGGDRGVREEAKALLRAGVVRVVSRRPDRAEGVSEPSRGNFPHGGERSGDGEFGDLAGGRDAPDAVHVLRRVVAHDRGQGIRPVLDRDQHRKEPGRGERLADLHQPGRRLGVAAADVVAEE